MVHISHKTLNKKDMEKLFDQFNKTIGALSHEQSKLFLGDFLGDEEQVLFAKRLAAIIMLSRGQSLYKIADTLKISASTAKAFQLRLEMGMYDRLFTVIKKDENQFLALIDAIDSILHLGGILPHYGQTHRSEAYKRHQKPFD